MTSEKQITRPEALALCQHWTRACSTNDPEAALSHFKEDVYFRSPRVKMAWEKSGGKIGSETGEFTSLAPLRTYLSAGLALPGILTLIDACLPAQPNRVACVYRRESGNLVCEVFDVEWVEGRWMVKGVENFCGYY